MSDIKSRLMKKKLFIYRIGESYFVIGSSACFRINPDYREDLKKFEAALETGNQQLVIQTFSKVKTVASALAGIRKESALKVEANFDKYNFSSDELAELEKQVDRFELISKES